MAAVHYQRRRESVSQLAGLIRQIPTSDHMIPRPGGDNGERERDRDREEREREIHGVVVVFATGNTFFREKGIDESVYSTQLPCHPEHVHIAFGDTTSQMVIMWATKTNCTTKVVYGTGPWNITNKVSGKMVHFTEKNPSGLQCLHRAVIENITPSTTYYYRPISSEISSGPFYFRSPPAGQDWSPEFLVYGDLGVESDSIPYLDSEVLNGQYTGVLHVGDFAYNLRDNGGQTGDAFMRLIQEIASRIPYLTSPGNHEIDDDTFAHYRYRFSMPKTDWPIPQNKMWYSIDIGPIHFVSYSSEVFFTSQGTFVSDQRNWLMADLKQANDNRDKCPWVIAFGHRPMYCSNADLDDCTKSSSKVRQGLEDLFYEYGVDLVIQAHEHSYERLWPMYKGVVLAKNYTNPQAPVQLISGAAGSRHGEDDMKNSTTIADWSAFRMDKEAFNSFGRLKIHNNTHIFWEEVAVTTKEVLDSVWITQANHGPFKETKLTPDMTEKIHINKQKEEAEKAKNTDQSKKTNTVDQATKPDSSTSVGVVPKVKQFLSHVDKRIVIGVSSGCAVLIVLIIIIVVVKKKRKPRAYRRWDEKIDYGRKYYSGYSHVDNGDANADDFEVEITDGNLPTSKLLTSDK
ncbi:hypothetical protein FSP39_010267 [Pinctada imbricata]|uniref:Purple acid phosphatase n=1 Tax=Pinctada imbricata TaxID=66713 RepID=A0AA89BKI5_PINIB|nr:hypothetical protein FSP39_010267 [Pinctada imbricata]